MVKCSFSPSVLDKNGLKGTDL